MLLGGACEIWDLGERGREGGRGEGRGGEGKGVVERVGGREGAVKKEKGKAV